jgi:hypothetical protein
MRAPRPPFSVWCRAKPAPARGSGKGPLRKPARAPLRVLLVQAAWVVWRQRQGRAALHAWVERLAARRGRRIAVVALARRLARILYAIWRDETVYQAVPVVAAA